MCLLDTLGPSPPCLWVLLGSSACTAEGGPTSPPPWGTPSPSEGESLQPYVLQILPLIPRGLPDQLQPLSPPLRGDIRNP